jgi:hypothetical protein
MPEPVHQNCQQRPHSLHPDRADPSGHPEAAGG